jgi:hypothetical protein
MRTRRNRGSADHVADAPRNVGGRDLHPPKAEGLNNLSYSRSYYDALTSSMAAASA